MMRKIALYALITSLIWGANLRPVSAQERTRILFVLDASLSMQSHWKGGTKWETACNALGEIADSLSQIPHIEIGLRVLGDIYPEPDMNCKDSRLEVPIDSNNVKRIKKKLEDIHPKGITPLVYAIEHTPGDFGDVPAKNILIVITDGEDACDRDACGVSAMLQKNNIILRPFIIGMTLDDQSVKSLSCAGKLVNTHTAEEFSTALKSASPSQILELGTSADFDLTTGYVHRYTQNFFKLLRPDDFVMKFDRTPEDSTVGFVHYIRRKDMTTGDKLGKNIAFFRQWKLSELDYVDSLGKILIHVEPSKFAQGCVSPNTKPGITNPFGPQVPFMMQFDKRGYIALDNFTKLDNRNGGTVVAIWEDKSSHQILFQDIHGPLKQVIEQVITISKKYQTDPTIAICDAGPMANKFVSNQGLELNCKQFPLYDVPFAGAGFGYVPQKYQRY